jgi:hypothetical protein
MLGVEEWICGFATIYLSRMHMYLLDITRILPIYQVLQVQDSGVLLNRLMVMIAYWKFISLYQISSYYLYRVII